jgi:hypothetical protein
MLIYSHKATHDVEDQLPEDLPPKARDAILRVAIAARTPGTAKVSGGNTGGGCSRAKRTASGD